MKDKYEISLWEDYQNDENDTYYSERKIAVIGSNDMTSPCRAYNPKLVQNVNGTNTFTFDMYMTYKENFVKDGEDKTFTNPFLALLVNERKVKVLWKEKWYDFIIKQCAEDSASKKITYTCKDLYVNELSKNGYDLEFDSELNNNYGTAQELVKATLKDTEWQLKDTENILQKKEEPVYELTLTSDLDAINQTKGEATTIKAGQTILVFYEQLAGETTLDGTYQFAYAPLSNYKKDTNSRLVVNADCYSADFNKVELTDKSVSENYRAERLVETKKQVYDPITKKYCYVLKATADDENHYKVNDEIYEFVETEYSDALTVKNLINNDAEFTNTDGWKATTNDDNKTPVAVHIGLSYDKNPSPEGEYFGSTFLEIAPGVIYENDGLSTNSAAIPDEGFVKGKYYIFRYAGRLQWSQGANKDPISGDIIKTQELQLQIIGIPTGGTERKTIFDSETDTQGQNDDKGYHWIKLTCLHSISKKDIQRQRLSIKIINNSRNTNEDHKEYIRWIKSIQFFPEVPIEVKDEQGNKKAPFICPYDIDTSTVVSTIHRYYNHTSAVTNKISSIDDIKFLWSGTGAWNNNKLKYEQNNFVKKRSISVSKSNRFNILQTIAEQFECWINFEIEHNQKTGEITRNQDGSPCKYVSVRQNIGKDLGFGFIYGIDLKSISRNIQSDQIVSKTIVLPNNNECAPGGFCAISSSKENYPGIDFILNFDYYISQGLLSSNIVNKDLYDSKTGYYTQLHEVTAKYKEQATKITNLKMRLDKAESNKKVFENLASAANTTINDLKEELRNLSPERKSYENTETKKWIANNMDDNGVAARVISLRTQEGLKTRYENNVRFLTEQVASITSELKTAEEAQTASLEKINELHKNFFNKYSHYIQEGTWTSEDYIDSTLYYLDAQSVAYTSSRPQVSYNISVLRLSSLEDFKNKIFNVGDISYIQDTEFFGYEADRKTPYKEQVIISEIVSFFDEPDKDFFTVQNYKTQFEDLFQRITSTTQSLQYASGSYARAAGIVESDGTIKGETLQSSIQNNGDLVFGATDESVVWNNTGITVSDKSNSLKKTRLTSGGLFISVDGGATWKNAVRGEGISTQYLTAGTINVGEIIIMDKNSPSFKWDSSGISAYYPNIVDKEIIGYDNTTYVRYDPWGIYGISNRENFKPQSEDEIYAAAKFGMTWNRFFMKNDANVGSVEISTDEDFQVLEHGVERIKIGRLQKETIDENGEASRPLYGLRLSKIKTFINDAGTISYSSSPTLVADSGGQLWLSDTLEICAETGDTKNIKIGYWFNDEEKKARVIEATKNFIVYEDGSVVANNGTFSGIVNAKEGTFGDNISLTQDGLIITDAGLRIQKKKVDDEGNVLEGQFDDLLTFDNGQLVLKDISAESGTIGGFTIEEDRLISIKRQDEKDNNSKPSIELNGSSGSIYANNIVLGNKAEIESFLQLGSQTKLFGKSDKNWVLITYDSEDKDKIVTGLKQDGSLKLGENINFTPSTGEGKFGNITIDGKNSIIGGNGWSITPTMATFSNIDLGTGTIHAARFEINQTQLVGGSMIFKQAYSINNLKQTESSYSADLILAENEKAIFTENLIGHWIICLKEKKPFQKNNKTCYYYISNQSKSEDTGIITISFEGEIIDTTDLKNIDGFIDLNLKDEQNISWTIAINSENSNLGDFGFSRGLSVSEFVKATENNNTSISSACRLFMGDLAGIAALSGTYTGVGLYCDNVYLKGEMATNNKSAGISTKGEHLVTDSNGKITGSIVLWAGADNTIDTDNTTDTDNTENDPILTAKFRVTDSGKVHADEGFFTNSTIEGSNIYAAHIYGGTSTNSAALSIHDTYKGIIFLKDANDTGPEEITLGIKYNGIYTSNSERYIINFKSVSNGTRIQLIGDDIYTNFSGDTANNRLHLRDNYIYGCGTNENHLNFIQFSGDSLNFGINNNQKEEARFQIFKDRSVINGTFNLTGDEITMIYKIHTTTIENVVVEDGYDLFIS